MRRSLLLSLVLPVLALPGTAWAQYETIDDAVQYKHCMALARQKPTEGWEEALAWQSLGGGEPARHCAAVALLGLEKYGEAASRLEALAMDSRKEDRIRAGMLAQAGQAWLLAERLDRAYGAQTAALSLLPGDPDLLIDRATTLAASGRHDEARTDLQAVLASQPNRVEALVLLGSAQRYLEDVAGAEATIARALQLDASYPDAWLEKGMLRRLAGDEKAAREAWLQAITVAPSSAAADTARRNIEILDVKH